MRLSRCPALHHYALHQWSIHSPASRSVAAAAPLSSVSAAAATAPQATAGASSMQPGAAASSASVAGGSGAMEVVRVPCLSDNYSWILRDPSGKVAVVDPAEPMPVAQALESRGWKLDYILNTHHHGDHVGGNMDLARAYGCTIVALAQTMRASRGISVQVGDGDTWQFGSLEVKVFDTPGHTRGHIAFWVPEAQALFPGDTIFALGCGRLFEGSPQQMWASLSKLLPLSDGARVYCAHEYTQSNARFAVTVDPTNKDLAARKQLIDEARAQGLPTVPSTLGEEKATNPFLRPFDAAIRKQLGFDASAPDWEVFGAIRAAKDKF